MDIEIIDCKIALLLNTEIFSGLLCKVLVFHDLDFRKVCIALFRGVYTDNMYKYK